MSRKIKDIKDKYTGELVYPRTHVSAVVLSSDSTLEDLVEVKQDKIDDLDEIRAGAAKGKTALQSVPSEYVTETELSNKGYATISALNNKVDAIDGKQLSTEDFTTALKNKLEGLNNYDDTELSDAIETLREDFDNIVSGDTTTAIKTFNEVIAFLDGLTDTQDLESIIASIEQQIAGKMDKVTLATVATSGNYNDLTNKPTIPAAVTESTVSGWGFTKNTGTYSKPSTGIPKTDLASAVQTSLGKADTALQSYTEQYKGTVTGVKINGTTKTPSDGIVDLGEINGNNSDYTFAFDYDDNTCKYVAAKIGNTGDDWNDTVNIPLLGKNDAGKSTQLIDGCNGISDGKTTLRFINNELRAESIYSNGPNFTITSNGNGKQFLCNNGKYKELKTINGESIIGSGDITISGGGVSEDYVNTAIANAITTTLNTAV